MSANARLEISRRALIQGGAMVFTATLVPTLGIGGFAREAAARSVARALSPAQLDSWLSITPEGSVTAYFGKMDMGQGVDTAVAQMVAEELDVPVDRVSVVLGDTALCPDQGGASGSTGLQRGGIALRNVAAEARRVLVERAAEALGAPPDRLEVTDGVVRVRGEPQRSVDYGELIGGGHFDVTLQWNGRFGNGLEVEGIAKPKDPSQYRIVGTSVPRVDQPGKILATSAFGVHQAVPGMLHGRMVRPPRAGARPLSVDAASIAHIPGAQVVHRHDLIGVVAETEWDAIRAAEALEVAWSEPQDAGFPTTSEELHDYIRATAAEAGETELDDGDLEGALAEAERVVEAEYEWPFQSHARMAPAFGLVDARPDSATVWTDSQKPFDTRTGVAKLLGLPEESVRGIWMPGAGSYGRSDAGDGAMDAAVLSQAVGRPVRVQWMRHEGHRWDPKGPASVITMRGGLDGSGNVLGYHFHIKGFSRSDMNSREDDPSEVLAGHLLGHASTPDYRMRTPEETYGFASKRYSWEALKPLRIRASPLRTAHFRDPLGPEVHFASESFIDELAAAAGADPVEFRLKYVTGQRDADVIALAAERAGWETRPSPNPDARRGNVLTGRGIAYAIRNDAVNAIVAEVEVDPETGRVWVRRFTVGADHGLIVNPRTLDRTIEGNLIQALSRTLYEEVKFDRENVLAEDWLSYPILEAPDVPEAIEIAHIDRPELGPKGAGEPTTRVTPPAIANAFFDATGVRLRRVPFTRERVKAALRAG